MDTADFDQLSESEKRHFYKCRCGEMVDKRQLDDVLFHEDHIHRPEHSIRRVAIARRKMNVRRSTHVYEVRPRKDKRGVNLISDALPFGRLWYRGKDAIRADRTRL